MQSRPLPSLLWVLLVAFCDAFYLPGVAPHEYFDGERVEIKVNKLSSTKTQLPYDYYSLPFCRPAKVINKVENLGEVLHGSVIQVQFPTLDGRPLARSALLRWPQSRSCTLLRVPSAFALVLFGWLGWAARAEPACLAFAAQNSPYELSMSKGDFKMLCRQELTQKQTVLLAKRIKEDYRVHLIMDNLPVSSQPQGGRSTATSAHHPARAPGTLPPSSMRLLAPAYATCPLARITVSPRHYSIATAAALAVRGAPPPLGAGRYQDDPRDARWSGHSHV